MQRSLNVILLLISLLLVYFSSSVFVALAKVQDLVTKLNDSPQTQFFSLDNGGRQSIRLEFEQLHQKLPWDADIGAMLIAVLNEHIAQTPDKGKQQLLVSRAQNYYKYSLSLRPRDVQLLTGQLDLLIDQGAPAEYILPKLDELISFVPKDQDLKAELAMICFKLLALNPQPSSQFQIKKRLQSLFRYSMDYRGLIHVRRYAIIYGQEDVLKQTLSQ